MIVLLTNYTFITTLIGMRQTVIVLSALVILSSTTAFANESSDLQPSRMSVADRKEAMTEKREMLKATIAVKKTELKTTITAKRCSVAENRIKQTIDRRMVNDETLKASYKKIVDSLQKKAEELQAKGIDITEVQAVMKILNQKIVDRHAGYNAYIAVLQETQGLACGESEGAFKAKLEEARVQLQAVQTMQQDIRAYIISDVKPAFIALRNQISVSPAL